MTASSSDGLLRAMVDAGLPMHKGYPVGDGTLHRYHVTGDKPGSLNGWYVLHLDGKSFGAFGSWKTGVSRTWTPTAYAEMSETERQILKGRMAEAKQARDTEQKAVYAAARQRAAALWEKAAPAFDNHPYLIRKAVPAYGLRLLRNQLVVPLRDVDGILHSLQFIDAELREDGRDKIFLKGGRKRGCYHAIGRPEQVLCICEGYATGATIYQATGHATAVAFDAGNLLPVAVALRRKFPRLTLVICADNDTETPGNPGLTAAQAAAQAVGAALAVPTFAEVAHV